MMITTNDAARYLVTHHAGVKPAIRKLDVCMRRAKTDAAVIMLSRLAEAVLDRR